MTKKEFLKAVSNSEEDVLQLLLDTLARMGVGYCAIDGLAVNAYAEPVVSLDIVVQADNMGSVSNALASHFKMERFPHSVNLSTSKSDLRIQLQTGSRYQPFIKRAKSRNVLGYDMKVAAVEDVLQGKVWAYLDEERRASKRQKDLADIARLVEAHPSLAGQLPKSIRSKIEG